MSNVLYSTGRFLFVLSKTFLAKFVIRLMVRDFAQGRLMLGILCVLFGILSPMSWPVTPHVPSSRLPTLRAVSGMTRPRATAGRHWSMVANQRWTSSASRALHRGAPRLHSAAGIGRPRGLQPTTTLTHYTPYWTYYGRCSSAMLSRKFSRSRTGCHLARVPWWRTPLGIKTPRHTWCSAATCTFNCWGRWASLCLYRVHRGDALCSRRLFPVDSHCVMPLLAYSISIEIIVISVLGLFLSLASKSVTSACGLLFTQCDIAQASSGDMGAHGSCEVGTFARSVMLLSASRPQTVQQCDSCGSVYECRSCYNVL